jgi:hypothetical protein
LPAPLAPLGAGVFFLIPFFSHAFLLPSSLLQGLLFQAFRADPDSKQWKQTTANREIPPAIGTVLVFVYRQVEINDLGSF